ncbi:MAG: Rieske 2Fe-2S domain-containing protein [Chthoniobacterales bacterium]
MIPEDPPKPESDPTQPCACDGQGAPVAPEKSTRRELMLKIGVGLNVVAGAMIGIPILGYVFSSFVRKMPLEWIALGSIDKFPMDTTRLATYENPNSRTWDGETAQLPCWVRRFQADGDEKFQVFAINCAHLGCPVRWFEESKLFLCPCHGGAYYQDGSYAAGPPPRGLYEYEYKVDSGTLYVKGGILPTLANPRV